MLGLIQWGAALAAIITVVMFASALMLRASARRAHVPPEAIRQAMMFFAVLSPIAAVASVAMTLAFFGPLRGYSPLAITILPASVTGLLAFQLTGSRGVLAAHAGGMLVASITMGVASRVAMSAGAPSLWLGLLVPLAWLLVNHKVQDEWANRCLAVRLSGGSSRCPTCDYPLPSATPDCVRVCPECGASPQIAQISQMKKP